MIMKEELSKGAVVKEPGSAIKNQTGTWRTFRPVVDDTKCVKCGMCELYCPDRTIRVAEVTGKKKIVIDYAHCKGCLICVEMCPQHAISKEREK
jgi:2-oxoacid:acceptor oxidoreductase delta subunit (pyruvate/2-ketoisovalerate family)